MKTVILFRKENCYAQEYNIASEYFEGYESRILCGGSRVIARNSVEPEYKELIRDLKYNSCHLINTYAQHNWVTSFDWYYSFRDKYTPESWLDHEFPMSLYKGPFVVKGKLTSKKFYWDTLMFAASRKEASLLAEKLNPFPDIGKEGIIFRKYVVLRIFEIGLNQMPITNDWRFFFYKDKLLTFGYYWANSQHEYHEGEMTEEGVEFAKKCAKIASADCTFFALDIAEKAEGGWILIDVNDAQTCDLNGCDPNVFYSELKNAIEEEK